MALILALVLTLTLALVTGCSPASNQKGFHSPNPASQLRAIQEAGQSRDISAVNDLVQCLGHDDVAVRMMAIGALEKIIGTRLNYNPYASQHQRDQQVARWVLAVEDGIVVTAQRQNEK